MIKLNYWIKIIQFKLGIKDLKLGFNSVGGNLFESEEIWKLNFQKIV